MVESVERGPCTREIGSLATNRLQAMTYKIDTFGFLAWRSALIIDRTLRFAQFQDNALEWDIGS